MGTSYLEATKRFQGRCDPMNSRLRVNNTCLDWPEQEQMFYNLSIDPFQSISLIWNTHTQYDIIICMCINIYCIYIYIYMCVLCYIILEYIYPLILELFFFRVSMIKSSYILKIWYKPVFWQNTHIYIYIYSSIVLYSVSYNIQ